MPGFWLLLRRAFFAAWEDGCFGIAKAAAYSALLSFFPVLTTVTAILVQANATAVSRILGRFLFEVAPPGTEDLIARQFRARGEQPISLLIVAGLLSVWAASGLMASLMEGFQAAYRLPTGRPMLKGRAVAIMLVFAAAVPAVGASALIVFGDRVEQNLMTSVGILDAGEQFKGWVAMTGRLLRYLCALLTVILVTAVFYYFGPNRAQRWKDLWPGALVATVLWLLATSGFGWYVRHLANYNVLYGSVGGAIALLVWMYLLAVIALYGCEFNAERERLRIA